MFLKYVVKANVITFWCNGIEENEYMFASLFDDFLLDLSKEKNVFFHGYRLWDEKTPRLLDGATILAEAKDLVEPCHIYWHLKEAKVKSNYFIDSCEATIYYFENNVRWEDFLVTIERNKPMKLLKKSVLDAYFLAGDHGADFFGGCSRKYEKQIFRLFEQLSNSGYEVKRVLHL